jgi:hypothetical protein
MKHGDFTLSRGQHYAILSNFILQLNGLKMGEFPYKNNNGGIMLELSISYPILLMFQFYWHRISDKCSPFSFQFFTSD